MFNTLKYAKMLEGVGFTRDQAETSTAILVEIMEEKLASKQDLQDLRVGTQQDLQELRQFIEQVELKLTIRMGTMLAASIAILTAIQKIA
jgi:hypothetical protein